VPRIRWVLAFLVAFAATADGPVAAPAPDVTGTWVLVEQTYGKGGSNLAEPLEPVRLHVTRDAQGTRVRILQGGAEAAASDWPALIAEGRALRSTARSVTLDAAGATLTGRCRVVPVEGEAVELDIRETYTLSADGKTLAGTVEVVFVRPDGPHGGYTLQRRFERER
jgi:hypothetical protein